MDAVTMAEAPMFVTITSVAFQKHFAPHLHHMIGEEYSVKVGEVTRRYRVVAIDRDGFNNTLVVEEIE